MLGLEEMKTICNSMADTVGTPAMAKLDREMIPILSEIVTLGPGNKDHPTMKQLYEWLLDPQRTAQEFCYVIGPLIQHVGEVMNNHFVHYTSDFAFNYYVSIVAAEAIAMRCHCLDGPWEQAAWILVIRVTRDEEKFDVSSHVSTWLISMIGDPDLCSNPCLRIELISLLREICDSKCPIHNRTQALESVLSAYSYLTNDIYLDNFDLHRNDIVYINHNLEFVVKGKHVKRFDKKLSQQRLPTITSKGFYGIFALLKTVSGCAQRYLQTFKQAGFNWRILLLKIEFTTCVLYMLLSKFKHSCQTPWLVNLTAYCIMDVLELIIYVSGSSPDDICRMCEFTLDEISHLMRKLLGEKTVLSISSAPLRQEINHVFQRRLKRLGQMLQQMEVHEKFSMLKNSLDLVITSLQHNN